MYLRIPANFSQNNLTFWYTRCVNLNWPVTNGTLLPFLNDISTQVRNRQFKWFRAVGQEDRARLPLNYPYYQQFAGDNRLAWKPHSEANFTDIACWCVQPGFESSNCRISSDFKRVPAVFRSHCFSATGDHSGCLLSAAITFWCLAWAKREYPFIWI